MLRKKLPYIQSICLDLYMSCKAKSKKDHGLPVHKRDEDFTPDEELVHFMLANSSITDSNPDSPRCFHNVSSAINTICKGLCPGQWCMKSHCKSYSGHCAYHCGAGKKPSTCKAYKEYVAKKEERYARKQNPKK